MKAKEIIGVLNGKKIPIALITFIIMTSIGYGELKQKVATLDVAVGELKETPVQMARVEQNVENLDENLDEFKEDTKEDLKQINGKLDKLVEALIK